MAERNTNIGINSISNRINSAIERLHSVKIVLRPEYNDNVDDEVWNYINWSTITDELDKINETINDLQTVSYRLTNKAIEVANTK